MSTPNEASRKDFRILVVDDDVSVLELMAEILEGAGWSVDSYANPVAALDKIKRNRYDALVLDLYMPELPGLLLHGKLKFLDRELWQRTVFVSGNFSTDELRRALEGTPRFVPKPFKAETLLGTVGMALPPEPRTVSGATASGRPGGTPVRS